jgi:hypothetical protein
MQPSTPDFEDAGTENELDLEVNDDANLDVDIPADDETDVPVSEGDETKAAKPAKATRPKAPEGFVKPVEFAKILSAHLDKVVPPQVVYSYVKNNQGDTAKNPFPVHTGSDGYEWYIKPEEGLKWWDNKNARVTASKAAKAEKAAKKASAAEATTIADSEPTAVVEAE